jgi:acyl-CoA reductase-like NAD-dependent aldehyde dehydrogenase
VFAFKVPLFINNEFVRSSSGRVAAQVIDPASQKILAETPECSAAELDRAGEAASEAFKSWRHVPVSTRQREGGGL